MAEYQPLTDPDLVIQKLRAAVQNPEEITDQVLAESLLDVITSRGGRSELELNPTPEVLLTLGQMESTVAISYQSVWLNIRPFAGRHEGYEVINNQGIPQLLSSDFEARTQTLIPVANTALRLRLLELLLDGHINTPL